MVSALVASSVLTRKQCAGWEFLGPESLVGEVFRRQNVQIFVSRAADDVGGVRGGGDGTEVLPSTILPPYSQHPGKLTADDARKTEGKHRKNKIEANQRRHKGGDTIGAQREEKSSEDNNPNSGGDPIRFEVPLGM